MGNENQKHYLTEKLCKLLVVENLQTTAGRDLTDGRRMEAVVIVAVATLHEYTAVTETFGKHLTADVIQVDTCRHTQVSEIISANCYVLCPLPPPHHDDDDYDCHDHYHPRVATK